MRHDGAQKNHLPCRPNNKNNIHGQWPIEYSNILSLNVFSGAMRNWRVLFKLIK